MRVIRSSKEKVDCYIGDIIEFKGIPCMVVNLGSESEGYGVLALQGADEGTVIAEFEGLHNIDIDSRTTELLIKRAKVIISEEGDSECPF